MLKIRTEVSLKQYEGQKKHSQMLFLAFLQTADNCCQVASLSCIKERRKNVKENDVFL